MALDFGKFFGLLQQDPSFLSVGEREYVQSAASQLILAYPQLGDGAKNNLGNALQVLEEGGGAYQKAIICSMKYHFTKDIQFFDQAMRAFDELPTQLADTIGDYWTLSTMAFSSGEDGKTGEIKKVINHEFLRRMYQILGDQLSQKFALRNKSALKPDSMTGNNRVVVLVNQLLKPPHAPTSYALAFANHLTINHGKEVMIVNSCEYSSHRSGAITFPGLANAIADYSHSRSIKVDGIPFGFFQPTPAKCTVEGLLECSHVIDQFDPSLVIVVGNCSLVGEVLAQHREVIVSPMVDSLPICINAKFHLATETEEAKHKIQELGLEENYTFSFAESFDVPSKQRDYTREELGLPEEAYVFVVVGNRLEKEHTAEFIELLAQLCSVENAFVLIMGKLPSYDRLCAEFPSLASHSVQHDYLPDIMAVYEHCDVFLNPERQGGGTSAAAAIASEMPVLSLPVGDVNIVAKHFPPVRDYTHLLEIATGLVTDPDVRQDYHDLTRKAVEPVLQGTAKLVSLILEHHEASKDRPASEREYMQA